MIAAALFALGLIAARALEPRHASLLLLLGGGAGLVALLSPRRFGAPALGVAVVLLGAGWWTLRIGQTPRDSIARALGAEAFIIQVQGVVASRPRLHEPVGGRLGAFARSERAMWCWLSVHRAMDEAGAWRPASGSLWVRLPAATTGLRMGQIIRVQGRASNGPRAANPGAPGPEWAVQEGRAGFLAAPSPGLWSEAPRESAPWTARLHARWLSFVGGAQSRALAWTEGATRSRGRALMASLLVGEREPEIDQVRESFTNAGMAHILAISGMHLTILAWTATLGLRLFGEPGRWEAPVVLLAVLLYVLIVPAGAPVVRAAIMTTGFLVAQSFGRRYDRLNILGWTMLAALLWRPLELWSAGFQLSFACVGALLWLAPAMRARWFGQAPDPDQHGVTGRLLHGAQDALCASVAAWTVSIPIVAFHFGAVPLLSVPASLIALPIATLALGVGYIAVVVGALLPGVGTLAGQIIAPIGSALAWIASLVDGLPFATVRTAPICFATAVGLTIVGAWWLRWGAPKGGPARARFGAALALAGGLVALDYRAAALPRGVVARVDTLAVGDGTCHLIRSGREALLWDCGSSSPGVGVRLIPGAARELGAWRVRTVVITHPNLDHFAGLLDIIEPLGVRRVAVGEAFIDAAHERRGGPEATALDWLRRRGVRVDVLIAGDRIRVGEATLHVLAPLAGQRFDDANDMSLVARLVAPTPAGERRFLFTGDIERPAMRALLERGVDVRAHALEAPHHGSAAGGAPLFFLDAVGPALVVQSTGPSRAGDERWDAGRLGRVWLTTATDGAVWAEWARDGALRTGTHSGPGGRPSLVQLVETASLSPIVPVPENETLGRRTPESNRSSAIAPGAR